MAEMIEKAGRALLASTIGYLFEQDGYPERDADAAVRIVLTALPAPNEAMIRAGDEAQDAAAAARASDMMMFEAGFIAAIQAALSEGDGE